jgi:hypothetical protein
VGTFVGVLVAVGMLVGVFLYRKGKKEEKGEVVAPKPSEGGERERPDKRLL